MTQPSEQPKKKKKAKIPGAATPPRAPKLPQAAQMAPPRRRTPANPHAAAGQARPQGLIGYGPTGVRAPAGMAMDDPEGIDEMGRMDDSPVAQLVDFIGPALERHPDAVFQLREGRGAGRQVDLWSTDNITSMDPEGIANQIYQRAMEDADTLKQSSAVFYQVWACRSEEAAGPFTSTGFTVMPENTENGYNFEDGATPGGQMAQSHRHLEVMFRVSMGFISDTVRQLRLDNQDLRRQNGQHFEQQLKMMKLTESLYDRTLERDLVRKRTEKKEERVDKVFNYALMFVPDIAKKFGLTPSSMGNIETLYRMLANMPQEQLAGFLRMLPDDEARAAVQDLWRQAKQQQAVEQRMAAKRMGPGPTAQALAPGMPGVPPPQQLPAAPPTTAPPAATTPTAETQVREEKVPPPKVEETLYFIVGELAKLQDGHFMMVMSQISDPEGVEAISAARDAAKACIAEDRYALNDSETETIRKAKRHIFGYITRMTDSEFDMLLNFVAADGHSELRALRATLLRAKDSVELFQQKD